VAAALARCSNFSVSKFEFKFDTAVTWLATWSNWKVLNDVILVIKCRSIKLFSSGL